MQRQQHLFDETDLGLYSQPEPAGFWDDAELIHSYTRRQAIEDGVLVQLSGEGYEGDE